MVIGTTAAIIGGSLIGAATSMYGSNRAASATNTASRRATEAELQMYNQSRADLAPYRQAGYGALDTLSQLYGIAPPGAPGQPGTGLPRPFEGGPRAAAPNAAPTARDLSSFFTSPQYEFVRSEGLRDITNSRAAGGTASGGNAVRGSVAFASGLASGEFQSYVDRLFGIAGLGSGATQVGVQAGQNTAANLANIYSNAGNARASAYMAGASGINSAIQGGLQNWAFNQYLNAGNPGVAINAPIPALPSPTWGGTS